MKIIPWDPNMQHFVELRDLLAKAKPEHFDMSYWYFASGFGEPDDIVFALDDMQTPCGSTACLAGFACLLTEQARARSGITRKRVANSEWVGQVAAAVLRIPNEAKMLLFSRIGWPAAYYDHAFNAGQKDAALALLDDIIAGHVRMIHDPEHPLAEGGYRWECDYEHCSLLSSWEQRQEALGVLPKAMPEDVAPF